MDSATTPLGNNTCPICSYHIDSATPIEGTAIPKPGDVNVCLNCGAILEFAADMALEEMTIHTWRQLDPEAKSLVVKAQRLIRKRGRIR